MNIVYYEWKRQWKSPLKIAVLCGLISLFSLIFLPFVQEANFVEELRNTLQAIPDLLLSIFGIHEGREFSSTAKYFAFIHGFIYLIGALFAAWLGGRCFSKERSDGTLDFLVARPYHRWEIFLYKVLANICLLLSFLLLYYLFYRGILWGVSLFKIQITMADFPIARVLVGLFFLQLLFFTVSLLVSAAIPMEHLAVAASLILAIGAYLLYARAGGAADPPLLTKISPFLHMQPLQVAEGKLPWIFYFLFSALFAGGAFALFYNQDIPHAKRRNR